jgi:hypothetical protein
VWDVEQRSGSLVREPSEHGRSSAGADAPAACCGSEQNRSSARFWHRRGAGSNVRFVPRLLAAGLALGLLNALVALGALASVDALTPDEFGWFAYSPLNEAVVQDPRFPWQYVVVPLALIVANVLALPLLIRRALRR